MRAFRGSWILLIPIVLLVTAVVWELIKSMMAKQERQSLIDQGIDPDTVAKKAPTLRWAQSEQEMASE
jgi:hypothetical protein